ncbi:phenylacetate--CoA ligase family protein [Pseudoduganella lutea]|uniref:Phenylacetate--CoA ligase family protein n=1 Tax=Pseudoduganella lutea TaxID=321985 RepID=A0A4P6KUK8_9BURK|nr:phenylacetate--CoA ligase family protein [Pseudoduganella lutea]QBE62516.1 phenylacetate--CoA ligase family protein [Pseudoduganella lutea]
MPLTIVKSLSLLTRHLVRRNPFALARAKTLIDRESLPEEALLARQQWLLRKTLTTARARLPAYSSLPDCPPDANPYDWLRQHYPVISKPDLVANRQLYYPNGGKRRPWWPLGKTSGTSGTPLEVFRSIDSVIWEEAFHLQFWAWAGHRNGAPQAILRGDQVVPSGQATPPFWLWDKYGKQLFMSTRHLKLQTAGAMLDRIATQGAAQLRAYPSSSYELARAAEQLNHPLRLRAVVTGSEPVYPAQREQIERAFNCRVFDFYGMAERTAFAAQCEHGYYHLNPEYSYVEILDERNEPTTDFGYVVGTTLHNHVMPLVRYRISDKARWVSGPCPCGRHYPRIELSSGKVEDQLYDADNNPVSASIITFALKGLERISKTQVAQVGPGEWEVRIVPDQGFSKADEEKMLNNIRDLVTDRLQVRIRLLDDIPLQASGKFKWVSQEWPGAKSLRSGQQ